ncbi:MAG: hypothetical protein KDA60_00925 [Planctomycetales bacterium]|nr:hypothetical protein [Planctomycetales bacterium]
MIFEVPIKWPRLPIPRLRVRPRFSLRVLMSLVTVLALALGWVIRSHYDEQRCVKVVVSAGGVAITGHEALGQSSYKDHIVVDFGYHAPSRGFHVPLASRIEPKLGGLELAVRRVLSEKVRAISLPNPPSEALSKTIRRVDSLEFVIINNADLGRDYTADFPGVAVFAINGGRVVEHEARMQ